jgi:hypothetical protein
MAEAEMRISVVEFEPAESLGRDGGDVILAGSSEGSAAGGVAACGGVLWTKDTGAMLGGTTRGRTSLGGTLLGGAVAVETVLVGTLWGGATLGGTLAVTTFWVGTGLG